MSDANDRRGLVVGEFGVTFVTADNGQPMVLGRDVRGGFSAYNDSERDALDGRRLDHRMIIWNTTTNEYQFLATEPNADGSFPATVTWTALQFAGGSIDSDDSDARHNHTSAIVTGRGLGFNRTDSELEITANKVVVFRSRGDRNADTTNVWSRGDVTLIEGLEYFTAQNRTGANQGFVHNGNNNQIVVYGITQAEYNTIIAAGVIGTTSEGANRAVITDNGTYGNNQNLISGQPAGQVRLTLDQDYSSFTSPSDLYYLTELGGINGGTYYFLPGDDTRGPTVDSNWQRALVDDETQNQVIRMFQSADSEINARIDSEGAALRSQIEQHDSDITVLQDTLNIERMNRIAGDAELQRQLDHQSDVDTELRNVSTDLQSQLNRQNRTDTDDRNFFNERIDSELRRIHGRVNNVTEVGYGLIFNHTDSELSVDSERLDSDFRLASRNLLNYESVFVSGSQDTERITISGNLNTAAPRNSFTSATIGRGRFPDLSRIGGLPLYGIVTESLIDINGTYIRDPRSNKVLRITDDRGQSTDHVAGSVNPNPGTGATVVESVQAFYSYWQPGGGGLEEGLSLVATNDRGFVSGNSTRDTDDSELPLNWRVVRGRWYDDTQFQVGQNFSGVPNGGSALNSPICTFNLFGDSDAKQDIPLGTLRDSDTTVIIGANSNAVVSTQNLVGGGSAVYAERNTSEEFFREIFDPNHGATREYVDGRLTEQGIQNLIGNTETLVTYSQPLLSFATPGPFPDVAAAIDRGHQLGPNTFLLKSASYDRRDGRYPSNTARYLSADIGPGENLTDARELWVRGSTDIFRNVLGKIVEDSVILFQDSEANAKFYWTVQSAVQQDFNENLYVITPKAVKYARGTLDTDATYQVYLKPNADDLVPGDRIVPESIQPLALHLDTGQSLQDGYGVTVRRSGDTFLFGIEQQTGGGSGSGSSSSRVDINNVVDTLSIERVDSDSDYLRLYGDTTEVTPATTGTRPQVSVQFNSPLGDHNTDTEMFTIVTPQGDSETYTVGSRTESSVAGRRANALLDYLNDNAVGNSLVFGDATLSSETVSWTFQQTGLADSEFFRSPNVHPAQWIDTVTSQGTADVPATYGRGLISQTVLPDVHINVREGTGVLGGALDGSAAVVITHGDDSDHFQLQPDTTDGISWALNGQNVTLGIDYGVASAQANNRFDSDEGGLVPQTGADRDTQEYFLAGDNTWRHVTAHDASVFNDSESGLVPAPGRGAVTGTQFLADDGVWKNPAEFVDSDNIVAALDFDVQYLEPTRVLRFASEYYVPATLGTDGASAWLNLVFTNDPATNSSGNRHLESDAQLLLRGYTASGQLREVNYTWSSADIIPGRGDEGQNDVSSIWAQAVGRGSADLLSPVDIGQSADNSFTVELTHEGPIDSDRGQANSLIVEFTSRNYRVEAEYVAPGVDRSPYADGVPAVGRFHTNGVSAHDSEKIFDTVILPLFDSDHAGLVPQSGTRDSELYLAGDMTWQTIPRSRIVFNDHEIDAYSDLFRIDYVPDSEELIFSARADIVDSDTRVESAGVVTFVPPSGDMFITDTHLIVGPTYTITIPQATPLRDYVGTFDTFSLSNDGRHTIIDSENLTDSEGAGARPPLGSFFATGAELTYRIQNVTRLESRIPIYSEVFDSEKRGLVPNSGDSDGIYNYLAGDGSWQPGTTLTQDIHVKLGNLDREIQRGLGSIEFDTDDLLFAPQDFTDLDINAGNVVITIPDGADSDVWRETIAAIPSGDLRGTLLTNFTHYQNGVANQLRVDLGSVNNVSISGNVITITKDSSGHVFVYDEGYNPITIDVNATDFGPGYFEQFVLQTGGGNRLDTGTVTRARTPATEHHAYLNIPINSVPVIDASGHADFRALDSITFNLKVDNLAVGSNPPDPDVTPRKDNVSYLRLVNGSLNRQTNGGQEIVSYTPYMLPVEYTADRSVYTWGINELAIDSETGTLYRAVRIPNPVLATANAPIDSEHFWQALSRGTTLSPTELIGVSQNPEVLTETGPATITGTDTGTYIQFSTTNAQVLTAYTIFYIRNAANELLRAEVYPGTLTSPPASGRVALRTYTTTPLGNTGWTDSV